MKEAIEDNSVGAVVVNFNSGVNLRQCLDSLRADPLVRRTVVVDNQSSDRSLECIVDEVLIRNTRNVGFAQAVNQGVECLSDCRDLLLVNPDSWLHEGALEVLQKALESLSDAAAVGPRIVDERGQRVVSARPFPNVLVALLALVRMTRIFPSRLRRRIFQGPLLSASGPPIKVDWLSGACMLISRNAWDRIGGLDGDFFLYGEELDWCWRAATAGWSCFYVPAASVTHVGGVSAKSVFADDEIEGKVRAGVTMACRKNMSTAHFLVWKRLFSQFRCPGASGISQVE